MKPWKCHISFLCISIQMNPILCLMMFSFKCLTLSVHCLFFFFPQRLWLPQKGGCVWEQQTGKMWSCSTFVLQTDNRLHSPAAKFDLAQNTHFINPGYVMAQAANAQYLFSFLAFMLPLALIFSCFHVLTAQQFQLDLYSSRLLNL